MTFLLPKISPTLAARLSASAFAFSAMLTTCACAQAVPKGEDLLRAMMNAERTISYSATETTTRVGAPAMVARVQKSGVKRRLEYSAPAIMKGDLLLSDGANLWLYHRAEKSAVKTKTNARRDAGDWKEVRDRVSATTSGQSTQAGRKAWLVTASSRDKKRVLRKIWIDQQTKARAANSHCVVPHSIFDKAFQRW